MKPARMSSREFIIRQKLALMDILSKDFFFILQHVHEKEIIDLRTYNMIMSVQIEEKKTIKLLDLLVDGRPCDEFLNLLQEDGILGTFPRLKEILAIWDQGTSLVCMCMCCTGAGWMLKNAERHVTFGACW